MFPPYLGIWLQFWLGNHLTLWSRDLLEKLTIPQLIKKFPTFYATKNFMSMLTTACHWSLSWVTWIQFTSLHPSSLRSTFILFSHLYLHLPSGFSPSGFQTKMLNSFQCLKMNKDTTNMIDLCISVVLKTWNGKQYKTALCMVKQKSSYKWHHTFTELGAIKWKKLKSSWCKMWDLRFHSNIVSSRISLYSIRIQKATTGIHSVKYIQNFSEDDSTSNFALNFIQEGLEFLLTLAGKHLSCGSWDLRFS